MEDDPRWHVWIDSCHQRVREIVRWLERVETTEVSFEKLRTIEDLLCGVTDEIDDPTIDPA